MKTVLSVILGLATIVIPAGERACAVEQKAVPFEVGEQLVFDVYFGLLKVGEATMTVTEIAEINGRRAYHIILRNRTNEAFSSICRVDDRFETFLDTATLLPLKFIRHLQEGNYSCNETTTFDHANSVADFESHSKPRRLSFPIEPDTQDTLSVFYAMRQVPIEIGKPLIFNIMSDEKVFELKIKPIRRIRKSIYRGGVYDTIQLIPRAKHKSGLFVEGRGWLWLSDDERKLPVCFRTSLPFGSITFALVKVHNIYQNDTVADHSESADTET